MRSRTAGRRSATDLFGKVREFFFAQEVHYGLAVVRILLPLVLFVDLLRRWSFVREIYSADGATTPIWITYGLKSPLPELPGAVAVALFTLLLAALITASLGWMTRVSLAISTLLYFYFTTLDSIGTLTKYTVIASHVLLLLTLSHCGAVWSLDALRKGGEPARSAVWPRRLMQLLFCATYLGAAMTKIHTPAYFNGDQMMWWILTHVNGRHPWGEPLAYFPALLTVGAYAAILWEILFSFLCWKGWGRLVMLPLGVGFHIATWIMLGLDIFPCVVISSYFCFANERDAGIFDRFVHRWAIRLGVPLRAFAEQATQWIPARRLGPIAFVALLWVVSLGGAAAERVQDPYGERGAGGPLPLRKIDSETAQRLLAGAEPLRASDKIFAFELGDHLFGDALIGRKRVFQKGETLIAQCIAAPPHGDMYIECNLHGGDGRIIERQGLILVREMNRLNFNYSLCDAVEPGEYEVVLKVSGTNVARRKFVVDGEHGGASPAVTGAQTVAGVLAD
ncbi:MAG: HTTM domain-containing protein [Planctomycetota bacterium]|nr:HTTM domain-containing protein [Planctomycetaceae bacterium]MDQ3330483.1 HTTM domain-containing protein [Planctomycetota bacterium]